MSDFWQHVIVLSIVSLLAAKLLWQWAAALFAKETKSGCATGCGACPINAKLQSPQPVLVNLTLPADSAPRSLD